MTIVSIRGTHGSGKSSIVRGVMALGEVEPQYDGGKRPYGYLSWPKGRSDALFIIGPYLTACGGCDAVQPYSKIVELIEHYAPHGDILFEGALVSSSYGSVGHLLNGYAGSVFAFLDTPLQTCLDRIKARRAAKGNLEPLNPKNTAVKFDNVARTKAQMAKLGSKVRIVDIDHTQGVREVLKLFGVRLNKEPAYVPA